MSMSALLSALRGAGRRQVSASTIGLRKATGSHVLRIDGYTPLRKTVGNGVKTRSGTFNVGGHDWRLSFYPNGCLEKHKGSISLFLEHDSHAKTGDTTAKFEFSILDEASKPAYTKAIAEYRFSKTTSLDWGCRDFIKHEDFDGEKYLKDDCLTVLCDVTVTEPRTDDHIEVPSPESEVDVAPTPPPFDLTGQLAEDAWNLKKVDVEIEVGGETFPAHRWVLEGEAGSPVFKAELSLASTADGITKLRVNGMDAEVFKALLRLMYTAELPERSQLEDATMAEKLLVAADRYELNKLKQVCEEALSQHIDMNSVAASLILAERHHCSVLMAACIQFLSSDDNLEEFMASDGFKQVKAEAGYPSDLVELVIKKGRFF